MILFFVIGGLIYKEVIDDINSRGVVLIGSGTVYSYLEKNYKEIFQYSFNKPLVAPLESPSNIGLEVLVNSYQRGEPNNSGIKKMNKLPEVIGMYSSAMNDTLFNALKKLPDEKYYAVQIGYDSLRVMIGAGDSKILSKFPSFTEYFTKNGEKAKKFIDTESLKDYILNNKDSFHLITTSTKSGTFDSWAKLLDIKPEDLIKIRNEREFDLSDDSKKFIKGLKLPYIILGRTYFNLDTPHQPQLFVGVFEVNSTNSSAPPLFLYGKIKNNSAIRINRNGSFISTYKLDKSVCKFWHRMIKQMKMKDDPEINIFLNKLTKDQLVFEKSIWDCSCSVIPDMGRRISVFDFKKQM